MFVVDSGASMHMLSKKDLSSDEMDTLRSSRNPTTAVTANGEVRTNEDAQVYVHDFDLFVTVQLLEETPAVLSFGKLCSEHRFSYEWKNGQTRRLTPNGETITCIMDNFCTSRCTRTVITFQQQLGFYIKTKGSVNIFW